MSFDYNAVLKIGSQKTESTVSFDEEEIVNKYRAGEYRIVTEQARYPLANLKDIFEEYNLTPDYQRRRVWDSKRKSRLIESFIINVPIPPVFLYEYKFSSYEVMDGLQRITAILDFFDNQFKLEGLDLWAELNGKYYRDLPEEIRTAVKRRYLSAIILLKETADNDTKEKLMKRFVFERLNTGGIELSPQEIRNALYTSDFNDRLIKMAESKPFRELWGKLEDDSYSRMEDCELVLRFFAYKSACKNKLAKSTIYILDLYAEKAKGFSSKDIDVLEQLFYETLEIVRILFGETAFKSDENSKKSEKMIYDAVMLCCAELIEEGYKEKLNKIEIKNIAEKKYGIINENQKIFNGKYTSIRNVNERITIFKKFLRGQIHEI